MNGNGLKNEKQRKTGVYPSKSKTFDCDAYALATLDAEYLTLLRDVDGQAVAVLHDLFDGREGLFIHQLTPFSVQGRISLTKPNRTHR